MTKYIKYVFENIEPLRISDDSRSQSGQMITLRYVPGTTVRGYIVNQMAKQPDFEVIKPELFSNRVRYLNAYISQNNQELIPSPKGFYEEKKPAKGKKEIENVIKDGKVLPGHKRSALGCYCTMDQDCVHYYNVETGSDLKIKINLEKGEKQNVFRNEYVEPNYQFTGYIAVEDDLLAKRIGAVFGKEMILGNARSSGFGKCRIIDCEISDQLPYECFMADTDQPESCYMMLLSNTAFRNQMGEICGLTPDVLKELGEKMQVSNLHIQYCSTSTVTVRGYNRTWGIKIPSVMAYEQGSVFHLKYDGVLTVAKMKELCNTGVGIRCNEGFGRVLFLNRNYENIKFKQAEDYFEKKSQSVENMPVMLPDEKKVLRIAARSYYKRMIQRGLQKFVLDKEGIFRYERTSSSQLGTLDSIITAYQFDPVEAKRVLQKYLDNAKGLESGNRTQKQHNSLKEFEVFIHTEIFDRKLEDIAGFHGKNSDHIMGVGVSELLSEAEIDQIKLKLILDLIRFKNKDKGEN